MRGKGGSKTSVEFSEVQWISLRKLLPYLSDFKVRIGLSLLCLVGAKIAGIQIHFLMAKIVDYLNQDQLQGAILAAPIGLIVAYGTIRFLNVLFGQIRDTLFGRVTEGAMHKIGHRVFQHLHSLDLAFHLQRRTGGLSRDIERGVNGISFLLRFMVFNIIPTFLEIGIIVGLLLWNFNFWFALIVVVSVAGYVGFSIIATEWRTRFVREMNTAESDSSSRSVDSLLNFETVKYFNNEDYEAQLYDRNLTQWETARRKNRLTLFALNSGQSLIIALAMAGSMSLAAYRVLDETMSVGEFVLINSLMMQIFLPLNFLGFVYREMKGSMANIHAMFNLLDVTPAVVDVDKAKPIIVKQGNIELDAVAFSYNTDRNILADISFSIPARTKVAIVGSSGSGKSTIMKLLFRFYDVESGQILIDGQNLAEVSQQSLRKAIGIVPQETVLFNTSIYENIRYGNINAHEEDIWQAIRLAYLEDFINILPEGVNTQVGERGLKLSGGEKQRVAIARAVLKDPKILIFDEATSSLDSEAEQKILRAMEAVRGRYTLLVIAHRLSTIIDADNIVVMDGGRIIEQGTHQQLLSNEGNYHRLWQLQQENRQTAQWSKL